MRKEKLVARNNLILQTKINYNFGRYRLNFYISFYRDLPIVRRNRKKAIVRIRVNNRK